MKHNAQTDLVLADRFGKDSLIALCAETGAKVLANDLWISGEEAYMFRSPRQWRAILGNHLDMEFVEVTELSCFEPAWQDWLATENEYAKGDAVFWETIIRPHTNFVGMMVRKRSE